MINAKQELLDQLSWYPYLIVSSAYIEYDPLLTDEQFQFISNEESYIDHKMYYQKFAWDNTKTTPFEEFLNSLDFEYDNGVSQFCLYGFVWFQNDPFAYLERIHLKTGEEFWNLHTIPQFHEFSTNNNIYYFI